MFRDERGLLQAAAMGDAEALRKLCSSEGAGAPAADAGATGAATSEGGGAQKQQEQQDGEQGGANEGAARAGGAQARFSLEEKGDPLGVGTCATPLWWAADGGHQEAVQCLLEYGADPRAADRCARL